MAANGAAAGGNEPPGLFGPRDPVFRPWPLPGREPANIAEFVQQLKTQGTEFRALTEDGLREEVAERARRKQATGAGGEDVVMEDADSPGKSDDGDDNAGGAAEADEGPPKDVEAMMMRRDEVLRTLESALQSGLIAVDFVSLLLSKDRPTQAMQTLSPLLREKIGIGTLSAGRIANAAQAARALKSGGGHLTLDETTRFNAQRLIEHKTECVGWQLLAMERTAAILAAARRRLVAELRREERYWAEVVAVHDRGWGLSRLPGQQRVLRVKFGFSEAAPDLSAGGFAPLRRVKRGHVELDMSALGPPSALVVTLRRRQPENTNTGTMADTADVFRSRIPRRLSRKDPLEDRILEARNTIYAKELWRELNREARAMVAHGVIARDNALIFPVDAHVDGVVTLEPLPPTPAAEKDANKTNDHPLHHQAEVIAAALHLFLSHGHRQRYRQRSVPAPPTDRTGVPPPTYFALRPVVAHQKYEAALAQLASFLDGLCTLAHSVGHPHARFRLYERPLSANLSAGFAAAAGPPGAAQNNKAASELLCTSFLDPREFSFELDLAPAVRLSIRSRTTVVPLKTQYLIHLLSVPPDSSSFPSSSFSSASEQQPAAPPPQPNPLAASFPPADHYANLCDVIAYVSNATAHILAVEALGIAQVWEARPEHHAHSDAPRAPWATIPDGMGVRQRNNALHSIRFAVVPQGTTTALDRMVARQQQRRAEGRDDDDSKDDDDDDSGQDEMDGAAEETTPWDADSPLQPLPPPELRVYASWPNPKQPKSAIHRKWTWTTSTSASQGADATNHASPVLQDVLTGCITGQWRPVVWASE